MRLASDPLVVDVVVKLNRAMVPVPDAYALRGQGQLASDQVSHACKITTESGVDEKPEYIRAK